MYKPLPFDVLRDLRFERREVRQQVTVREQNAFRFGGGAGGEDDFDERLICNRIARVSFPG